jgi:hypothetical protein
MTEIKAPLPESSPLRRPWHRLHLSTWIVLFLMTLILTILIVPGEIDERIVAIGDNLNGSGGMAFGDYYLHGWPWEYLDRYPKNSGSSTTEEETICAPWLIPRCWSFFGEEKTFSPMILVLDFIVACVILVLVTLFLEWRSRRRLRIWQFTLLELIVFTIIVAGICSWWRTNHLNRQKEQEIISALEKIEGESISSEEYRGPAFLRKLIGLNYLTDFYVTKEFDYDDIFNEYTQKVQKNDFFEKIFTPMVKLQYLESIDIKSNELTDEYFKKDINKDTIPAIWRLKRLKHLVLWSSNITDKSVELLKKMTQLEELHIQDTEITQAGIEKLQTALPKCEIMYRTAQDPTGKDPASEGDH